MAVETPNRIELEIGGMTCTSCAAQVEKKLNKLDGVVVAKDLVLGAAVPDTLDH